MSENVKLTGLPHFLAYAPRLRTHVNSFLAPVVQPSTAQAAPASRTTKRGTVVINYSEDLLGDDDFDDSDGPRRPTGLRSRREDPNQGREGVLDRIGKELNAPVDVQGIWRDWMGKPKFGKLVTVLLYEGSSCVLTYSCLERTSSSTRKPHCLSLLFQSESTSTFPHTLRNRLFLFLQFRQAFLSILDFQHIEHLNLRYLFD